MHYVINLIIHQVGHKHLIMLIIQGSIGKRSEVCQDQCQQIPGGNIYPFNIEPLPADDVDALRSSTTLTKE